MSWLTRRAFCTRALAVLGSPTSVTRSAASAGCPTLSGPVRWVVPNAPGGGYDELSRLLEPHLEKVLGVRIQVDNVPGAGGLRGAGLVSEAAPNGQTLGILNLPGLLMARLDDSSAPDPVDAFTLLGTVARSRHVWSTAAGSEIRSIEDALRIGRSRGLVFAVSSFNSQGFFNAAVPCALLGLRAEFVAGYGGSGESILAAIRGDVDLVSVDAGTQVDTVGAGDLRPLFRISAKARGAAYQQLPSLTGPDGLAQDRGAEAVADAEAFVRFTSAGRVLAGPPKMAPALAQCLDRAICTALGAPEFERRATAKRWILEPSCAADTLAAVRAAREDARRIAPIIEAARAKARG